MCVYIHCYRVILHKLYVKGWAIFATILILTKKLTKVNLAT